jgi:hypothetical protein
MRNVICLVLALLDLHFDSEYGGNMFHRNVDKILQVYTTKHSRMFKLCLHSYTEESEISSTRNIKASN